MEKRRWTKLFIPLLAAVLISTSLVTGTLAKYTSAYSGSDTALVAKWEFISAAGQVALIDDDAGAPSLIMDGTGTKRLDLFQHQYDQHILQKDDADYIIAPGVEGEFFIILLNRSDVAAYADLTFAQLGNADVPLEYNIANMTFKPAGDLESALASDSWVGLDELKAALIERVESEAASGGRYNEFAKVVEQGTEKKIILLANDDHNKNIFQVVLWRWAYDKDSNRNAADTALGKQSASESNRTSYGIEIRATATQVLPE